MWLTLEGSDAHFVAVEQENKKWAVAWDGDGSIRAAGGWDDETDSEDDDEGETGSGDRPRRLKWLPVRLRRRLQLGMESSYVKSGK